MPDNIDSVMVVLDHPSGGVPGGWTHFASDGLIARRVLWVDFRKGFLNNKKVVLIKAYQFNAGSTSPYETVFSGKTDYSVEQDPNSKALLVCKHQASGGGAGTTRHELLDSLAGAGQGGGSQESWGNAVGQVPLLGIAMQDASPSAQKLAAAQGLNTDSVPLG